MLGFEPLPSLKTSAPVAWGQTCTHGALDHSALSFLCSEVI